MNLADPNWELIDPTPNVHGLFVQFDKTFFWTKLGSVIVKWSKRMYSCAGTCTYHVGSKGCIITLSEPLLKLRPRKDLVETLLHEMIHAYLFITGGDQDRDGHGPMFKSHMYRINQKAGLNISIYHDFHDEVKLYQTHWWRCNGPCQHRQPFFGIVKRSSNRAPGPNDFWWKDHKRHCQGEFIKIKEPEKKPTAKSKKSNRTPIHDISNYFSKTTNSSNIPLTKSITNTNIKTISNINDSCKGTKTKSNSTATVVVTKNNNNDMINKNGKKDENKNVILWNGDGHQLNNVNKTLDNKEVSETVRNVWANKVLNPSVNGTNSSNNVNETVRNVWANKQLNSSTSNTENKNKRRITDTTQKTPPSKITKINDYFDKNKSTIPPIPLDTANTILQNIYGEDFKLYQNEESNSKIIAVQNPNSNIVKCPICTEAVRNNDINRHLDECLNKEEIETITQNKADLNNTFGVITSEKISNNTIDLTQSKPGTSQLEVITVESENVTIDLTNCDNEQKCPCCNKFVNVNKSLEEHLDECLSFMDDQSTVPEEGNSMIKNEITSDDDDYETVDESTIFNETGTKFPCPCCLVMVEQEAMNNHLDRCLNSN